mgnify:CR=1 FL=1
MLLTYDLESATVAYLRCVFWGVKPTYTVPPMLTRVSSKKIHVLNGFAMGAADLTVNGAVKLVDPVVGLARSTLSV